jgi:insulysin
LGHEGEGSVYAALKNQGWATALVSGPSNSTKEFDFFKIDIDLTEEGFKHREQVVETVFQYVRLLKEQGPQEWIFNEMKVVGDIEFQNVNKRKPISYVSALSTSMQWYKPKDVISAAYLHERYDPVLIKSIIDCLTPDNLLLLNVAKDFKGQTDKVEEWYGTEYSSVPLDEKFKTRLASVALHPQLYLPPRNEFIPDDLSIRPVPEDAKDQKAPKLIRDGPQSKLWFLQDSIFELPKGAVQLQIWSPESYSSPHNSTTTRIMAMLVQDALNEFSYNAQIAGLDYKIEFNPGGVLLVIMGFNQKIPVLLSKIISKLAHFDITQERFSVIKEKFLRDLINFAREPPHAHTSYFMMMCANHPRWGWEEQVNILKELELKHVAAFVPLFIKSSRLEWLIHGNFSQKEAVEMVDSVEALLPASKHHSPMPSVQRTVKFHKGIEYLYQRSNINADDHNSAVYSWYQAGNIDDTVMSAQISLIDEILREPCYDQLRTKEQLGYIVWSTLRTSCGITGWRVTVQSSEYDAQHVDARIESFVESAVTLLQDMGEEEFQAFVDAVIAKNLEKPHSIFALNMQLWEEITVQKYLFNRRELESDILRKTKKEDVVALFKRTVADKATRRKMSVQLYANGKAVPTPVKDDPKRYYIEDIYAFRERMPLCAPSQ